MNLMPDHDYPLATVIDAPNTSELPTDPLDELCIRLGIAMAVVYLLCMIF